MKKISAFAVALAALLSCQQQELGPTIKVPDDQGEGSRLDAPGVRVIDVKTDRFTANWEPVVDALNYEYVFDDGEPQITTETVMVFDNLAVDTEHVLRICANPRPESGRLPSPYVSVSVVTSEVQSLDMPALKLGDIYSSIAVVSWGIVPSADHYEWRLGDGEIGTTDKTFLTFEGLFEGREYRLEVRSVPSDTDSYLASGWAGINFIPVNDGNSKLLFSNFKGSSDAVSFNVYANAGQYYYYDIIPLTAFNRYASEEAYFQALLDRVTSQAAEKINAGASAQDAWASVLKSGSTSVIEAACASLSYSVTIFGMNLEGKMTTEPTRTEVVTPAVLDSDGPEYKSKGDWYNQTVMLGNATSQPPTSWIFFNRIGTGVVSVRYLLYTTDRFIKKYGSEMDTEAVNEIISTALESGSTASDEALAKINGTGQTAGYSGRLPGTAYTIVSLATNESGNQILVVNSITTRSSEVDNCWVKYSLKARDASSFTLRVTIDEGLDAVAGKVYCLPSADIPAGYNRANYASLVESKGTAFTAEQIRSFAENGYVDLTYTDLKNSTNYFVGVTVTDSVGDTTLKTSSVTTK